MHVKSHCDAASLPFVVEGVHDRPASFIQAPHKVEVSVIGPQTRELNGFTRIFVDLFATLTSHDGNDGNVYSHEDFAGVIARAFDSCIEVRNYEPGVTSPSLLGVLRIREGAGESVSVTPVRPTDTEKLRNTVIEVRLVGYFPKG